MYQCESNTLGPKGMEALPEDIQWYIWRIVFKQNVVPDILTNHKFIWEDPSDQLLDLCRDPGCIQQGHSELEEMIEDQNMWCWEVCVHEQCDNCRVHGFPCLNLAAYGFENSKIAGHWQPNFVF